MSEVIENELPDSWESTDLENVLQVIRGISFKSSDKLLEPGENTVACLRTANVQENVDWSNLWWVPEGFVKREEQFIQLDDILISNANSYELVGKVSLVRNVPEKSTLGAFITMLRARDGVDPKFFFYQLRCSRVVNEIRSRASTTTNISNVSTGKLKDIPLWVAPLEQQKRIVAKIEELFSHIDAGIDALNKAKQLLKQYRQSVLKAAVTGELTKDWREKNKSKLEPASELLERILIERRQKWEEQQLEQFKAKGKLPKNDKWKEKYKEPSAIDKKHKLPEGWLVCSFEELILELKNGISKKPSENSGLAILRISSVRPMIVHIDDVRYLPEGFDTKDFEIEEGDLLFTRYNGNPELVGVCGKVKRLENKTVYPDKLMRARPVNTDFLSTDYLELSLNCGISKDFIRSVTKTTAGQSGIAGGDVKKCPVVLPPHEEQIEIAIIVAEKIEIMQKLDLELNAHLVKAEKNKQSILASAFKGKLL